MDGKDERCWACGMDLLEGEKSDGFVAGLNCWKEKLNGMGLAYTRGEIKWICCWD